MNVYKFEIMVIDFDGMAIDEVKRTLQCTRFPNDCISLRVMDSESAEIEWDDDHPLNHGSTQLQSYRDLFEPKGEE